MDATILCNLLAQRIPAEQFQLWGLNVHWMDGYDTPANEAIAADVIANYDTLLVAYEAEQAKQAQIATAKAYLAETDYKMLPDYTVAPDGEPLIDIKSKRSASRALIRSLS